MSDIQLTPIEDLSGSLAQRVYLSLQHAILDLRLPPGAVIKKGVICDMLGVSRSPVAEAIARLSAERLVEVIPQSATKVSGFSMDEIREACFIREAIELAVVGRIAETRTEGQLKQLTREVRMQKMMIEDGDADGFFKADEKFHALMLEFTGFPGVADMTTSLSVRLKRPRMLLLPEENRMDLAAKEHQAILEGIKKQDVSLAQDAMRKHLNQLLLRLEPLEEQHSEYFKNR